MQDTRKKAKECGDKFYFTGIPCKSGHVEKRYSSNGLCCGCNRKRSAENYEKDREKILRSQREYYKNNIEKVRKRANRASRKHYAKNKEKCLSRTKEWQKENRDRINDAKRKWLKNNPEKNRIKRAKERIKKLKRTPTWLTIEQNNEINEIYKNCPSGYHVDHIVPLCGDVVSGLHVPWNLQYLPASENIKKGNSFVE